MRDYADEANLHARIYAMRGRLLSLKDYVSLARHQNEALNDPIVNASDPVAAEEIVFREQIANIIPLAEANRIYAPLFLAFFRQFEALNAKLILTKAFGLQSLEQWYDIGPYAILDRTMLQEATNLQNIRRYLTGTYLADILEDVASYEQMEISVDLCVARNLYAASALFSNEAKLDFQKLMGRRIAVTSTILSLRLKKTYQWDDEKTRPFLERIHDAFGGKIWPQVKVVEEARDEYLDQLRASGAQEPSVVDVEHYLEQYYYNWISRMFHRDFHSIYCVVAYLWLLFYQIRNLFKIIEGRRSGFSPERIIARIVCDTRG
jgi:vacuolar-type H+-ATPase subunit C/Vma6